MSIVGKSALKEKAKGTKDTLEINIEKNNIEFNEGCGGGRCGNGCNPMCITNVTFGCQSCENGCGGGCQSCTGTCDTGCYSYCSRNGCKTNCQSNCQNSCSSDCANSSRYGVYKYHN